MNAQARPSTILLTDPYRASLTGLRLLLESGGHRVLAATDGESALSLVDDLGEPIDVAVLSSEVADMSCAKLLNGIASRPGALRAAIVTGVNGDGEELRRSLETIAPLLAQTVFFFATPLDVEALEDTLTLILGTP